MVNRNVLTLRQYALFLLTLLAGAPALAEEITGDREEQLVVLERGSEAVVEHMEAPVYPPSALAQGVESWVQLRFDVDEQGRPVDIEVYEAAGDGTLHKSIQRAALRALAKWRFEPATLNGEATYRENFSQFISFQLSHGDGGMTRAFRGRFSEASKALDEGDMQQALTEIETLEKLPLNLMSEHAYLAMLRAMVWQEMGQFEEALVEAERARLIFNDAAVEAAYEHVLRMTVMLNGQANNLRTALERYDTLLDAAETLPEDDPIHEVASRIRAALDGAGTIVREGAIERCERCRDESYFFERDLNRGRFLVEVVEGRVDKVKIRCHPAHVSLAWSEGRVWTLANSPEGCGVVLRGEPGSRVRLVELPDREDTDRGDRQARW